YCCLLLLLLTFSAFSQSVKSKVEAETVVCVTSFYNKPGQIWGCGFIINGKYLATTYHLYKSKKYLQVKKIYAIYNVHYDQNNHLLYDSVFVSLNYKPKINQYNFKTHIYNV